MTSWAPAIFFAARTLYDLLRLWEAKLTRGGERMNDTPKLAYNGRRLEDTAAIADAFIDAIAERVVEKLGAGFAGQPAGEAWLT